MNQKNIILIIAIVLIVSAIIYLEKTKPNMPPPENIDTAVIATNPPDLTGIAGFINTPNNQPISIKELIGKKVILVDFWTYSCINCKRTQPYLNDWYEKYEDDGLEIIGVHTPEFEFEKDYENVKDAVIEAGIKYPVALDNNYSTWRAYGNRYWPRKYIIDLNGQIVYDHIGEGAYAETEAKIQELLKAPTHPKTTITQEVNSRQIKSPEIYFGSDRFDPSWNVKLTGDWQTTPEYALAKNTETEINYTYTAKNVYMVAAADKPVDVDIYVDGVKTKTITIQAETLYTLVAGKDYGTHELKLIIKNEGLKAYTFTFG